MIKNSFIKQLKEGIGALKTLHGVVFFGKNTAVAF